MNFKVLYFYYWVGLGKEWEVSKGQLEISGIL